MVGVRVEPMSGMSVELVVELVLRLVVGMMVGLRTSSWIELVVQRAEATELLNRFFGKGAKERVRAILCCVKRQSADGATRA